jgi:DnaA family protein
MQQIPLDFASVPRPTLENFVAGANAEVLSTLRAWLAGSVAERCICLWGLPGSGKSHLLHAVVAQLEESGAPATYVGEGEALPASQDADGVLAIDAIDALDAPAQARLFTLLNAAAQGELRLLLAAGNAPVALALREDVRTRVALGLVLQVRPLSDEEKREALAAHAHARSFDLPVEVIDYLLVHGQRDLPSLMALLDAADRYSLQMKRPVTLPLMREVLEHSRGRRNA